MLHTEDGAVKTPVLFPLTSTHARAEMKAGDYLFSGDYMEGAGVPLQGGAGSFLVGDGHLLEQAPGLLMQISCVCFPVSIT